ncbi:MAG: hypothetical protein IT494_05690 [Gammaproteobacteria bacterium]|nr:hypothetical protein [Gammaproteobacteria bacterium]
MMAPKARQPHRHHRTPVPSWWRLVGVIGALLTTSVVQAEDATSSAPVAGCGTSNSGDAAWLDRMRGKLTEATCTSARWFDGLFGTPHDYDAYRGTYGSFSVGTLWDEYDGFDPKIRFKARLRLPQLNGRLNAFIGRVDEDEFVTGTLNQFDTLPDQFRDLNDAKLLVGLGYSRPGLAGQIDVDAGVHVDIPLDPYLRANYRRAWAPATDVVIRFRQSAFWQYVDGVGTSSKVDVDLALAEHLLLRTSGLAKVAEKVDGVEWNSKLTLYHELSAKDALAYQLAADGETGRAVPLRDYGVRIIYRRQFLRDWLILELRGGIGWPRELITDQREFNWGLGAALEMRFGDWPSLRPMQ